MSEAPAPKAAGTAKPSRTLLNLGNLPPKRTVGLSAEGASYQRTPSRVDPNNPPWPAYRGYHEYSFAHETMGKRLPTILGKAIDDTIRTLNDQHEEVKIVDLLKCIERMGSLKEELQKNATLRAIIDDGEGDVALWNKEIAKFFRGASTSCGGPQMA
jgi:damage-control phosphatase, subfamily III